jgi:hypothetical protein
MKPGTIIQLPDGRVGTICWRHLDGEGGVWGEHDFSDLPNNFDDGYPAPEFMLREKSVEALLRRGSHRSDLECVGTEWTIMREPTP